MRVYLDSCWVIYLVERNPQWAALCSAAFEQADAEGAAFITSELVRLECRIKRLRTANAQQELEYASFLAALNGNVAFTTETFELATQLRAHHTLKTPDALHLAAAITHQCEEFWTNDARFEQAAAGRIRIVTPHQNPTNP